MTADADRRREQDEVDDFLEALDGRPEEYLRLKRELRKLDPHAAEVLAERSADNSFARTKLPEGAGSMSKPSAILADSFLWRKTPEGKEYWGGLFDRLVQQEKRRT